MLDQQNHAAGGANGSIMVRMFVCLCLASKKPSKQEFFIPAGPDLGVKLLSGPKIDDKLTRQLLTSWDDPKHELQVYSLKHCIPRQS